MVKNGIFLGRSARGYLNRIREAFINALMEIAVYFHYGNHINLLNNKS